MKWGLILDLTCLIFNKRLTSYLDLGAVDKIVKHQKNWKHTIYKNSFNEHITVCLFDKHMFLSFRLLTFYYL